MFSIEVYVNQNPFFQASHFNFAGSYETTYESIKNTILSTFGIYESQFNIHISARYYDMINGRFESIFLPINSEDHWRHLYHESFEARRLPSVELYVDLIPAASTGGTYSNYNFNYNQTADPNLTSEPGSSSSYSQPFNYPDPTTSCYNDQLGSSSGGVWGDNTYASSPQLSEELDDIEELDEEDDRGPASHSDCPTGEEETDSDYLSDEPRFEHTDGSYIYGRTETYHPCSQLTDFSSLRDLGRSRENLGPTGPIGVGKVFQSKDELKFVVENFHCKECVEFVTKASNRERLILVCADRNSTCKWRLYARVERGGTTWKIITNEVEHSCTRKAGEHKHVNLTAALIAECIREDVKKDLGLSVQHIGFIVDKIYPFVKPTYNKLWRAKEKAIEQLFGTWEGSYTTLPTILMAIQQTTPGTKVKWVAHGMGDPNKVLFKCAAWAYGPCIQAVPYLRPVITIDATFLSGRYKGKLMIACGYDAEQRLLPLAFGLVETEDEANWGWFMRWVRNEVIGPDRRFCVISDRHWGIRKVFESPLYGWQADATSSIAVHRFCMQHVAENLWKAAGGAHHKELRDDFKLRLANKKKPRRFREKWKAFEKTNPKAIEFLRKCGKSREHDESEREKPEKWAQCFDGGHRWGIMTSNGSESLNSTWRIERTLPVVALVEGTWYKSAGWFNERKMKALAREAEGHLWPKIVQDKLNKHDRKAAGMTVTVLGLDRGEFEVQVPRERLDGGGHRPRKYTVKIDHTFVPTDPQLPSKRATCQCQKPQFTGIPCAHVIAVCRETNWSVNDYVDPHYSIRNVINTWSGQFHSYGDQDSWPVYDGPVIVPNRRLINRGRRKKLRNPMAMDAMEGSQRSGQRRSRTPRRNQSNTAESNTEAQPPPEPLPMEALQSGRRTVPTARRRGRPASRSIQSGRLSLNVDPRVQSSPHENFEGRRNSISVDPRRLNTNPRVTGSASARFASNETNSGRQNAGVASSSRSGGGIRRGIQRIGSTIRSMFPRRGSRQ